MLTIRAAQMKAFAQAGRGRFEQRAVEHVRTHLPEDFAEKGEAAVLESARLAMQKAEGYGLTDEFDILRYLNLMYVLGFEFDTDSSRVWASEILSDKSMAARTRMDVLTERAKLEE